MERVLLIAVLSVVAGCTTGRWVQEGKTDLDSRRDSFDCENVIGTKHGGWQRVEPFTSAMEIRECMQVKGYHLEQN
jgi:hypothetical protein